jgi:hypothetical protein
MWITAPRVVGCGLESGLVAFEFVFGLFENTFAGSTVLVWGSKKEGPPGTAHITMSRAGFGLLRRLGHRTTARLYAVIRFEAARRDTS